MRNKQSKQGMSDWRWGQVDTKPSSEEDKEDVIIRGLNRQEFSRGIRLLSCNGTSKRFCEYDKFEVKKENEVQE